MIRSNIVPPLINILQNADFKTKKEACWALSNATSGGLQEPNQIRYLVSQGCIKPMCDLLQSMDNKIIQVSLDGLENILKVGEMDKEAQGSDGINHYAQFIEEAGGMVAIHNLQHHDNLEIYKKCFYIMDSEFILLQWSMPMTNPISEFFPDDDEEEAEGAAPAVDASGQYAFQSDGKLFSYGRPTDERSKLIPIVAAPQGGFNFGGQ